jgi:hypothetical protein
MTQQPHGTGKNRLRIIHALPFNLELTLVLNGCEEIDSE